MVNSLRWINLSTPLSFLRRLLVVALLGGVLVGCERSAEPVALQYSEHSSQPQVTLYRFAVHPLHNPHKLSVAYQPLMQYLNQLPNVRFELEASVVFKNLCH